MHWSNLNTIVLAILVAEQIIVPIITDRAERLHWKRITSNLGLTTSLMLVLPVLNLPLLVFATNHGWVRPVWMAGVGFLVVDFVLLDFVKWLYHWMAHRNAFLWRFHAVHHLDEQLDMSTNDRGHILDKFFRNAIRAGVVLVFAIPLSSMVTAEIISTAFGLFHHRSSLRVPAWIQSSVGRIFTMPDFHTVHHSAELPYTDSNYGITLCFWDSLFGTTLIRRPLPGMRRGLDGHRDRSLGRLLIGPLLPGFSRTRRCVPRASPPTFTASDNSYLRVAREMKSISVEGIWLRRTRSSSSPSSRRHCGSRPRRSPTISVTRWGAGTRSTTSS